MTKQVRCVRSGVTKEAKPGGEIKNRIWFVFTMDTEAEDSDQWEYGGFNIYTDSPEEYEVGKLYTLTIE